MFSYILFFGSLGVIFSLFGPYRTIFRVGMGSYGFFDSSIFTSNFSFLTMVLGVFWLGVVVGLNEIEHSHTNYCLKLDGS